MKESRKILRSTVYYIVMIAISVLVAFPFLWMIMGSFKTSPEFYYLRPTFLPEHFILDNFAELIHEWHFMMYYKNSIFITLVQVLVNLVIVLCAGYGFAKYEFRGKIFFFVMILSSTMIPWVATIIPLYIMASSMNLIDTYTGLIIPGMANAFNIFLARNFMTSIPTALLESARIEGASEFRIFRSIVVPAVKPLIAVITIQKTIDSWNAFQWPLLVTNSERLRTIPLAIAKLSSQFYDSYNLKMAAATLAIIPVLCVYVAFQKYFVEGVTLSGIK